MEAQKVRRHLLVTLILFNLLAFTVVWSQLRQPLPELAKQKASQEFSGPASSKESSASEKPHRQPASTIAPKVFSPDVLKLKECPNAFPKEIRSQSRFVRFILGSCSENGNDIVPDSVANRRNGFLGVVLFNKERNRYTTEYVSLEEGDNLVEFAFLTTEKELKTRSINVIVQ